jgi:hypothetical protein
MKKVLAFSVVLLFSLPAIKGQENMFDLGDKVISVGLGIGNTLYIGGAGYSTMVPPLSLTFEQAVVDDIFEKGVLGVVGSFGYTAYKYRYNMDNQDWGWDYHNIILGAGAILHYPLIDRLDTYLGAMLGYNLTTIAEYGDTGDNIADSAGGFVFAGFVGARYYFTEQFAAFAQLGYGVAYLTLGVSIRL